jgi:plasmid stability protein
MIAVCFRTDTKFGLQTCSFLQSKFYSYLQKSKEKLSFMANRKGVFIGAYVPNELKESLRRRAAAEHRTLSQEITRILVEAVHGKGLPAGSVDRRTDNTIPRRRTTDPFPRRRSEDLQFSTDKGEDK